MTPRPRTVPFFLALLLHALAVLAALLLRLPDPPRPPRSVELRFEISREKQEAPPVEQRQAGRRTGPAVIVPPPVPAMPAASPSRTPSPPDPPVTVLRPPSDESAKALRPKTSSSLRSVLDRDLTPEEAWDVLSALLDEYPQYRESVAREMIAGAGLLPDSLRTADLHFERIFRDGIPPSWGRQREVIENAFRSYDPVMGWNRGFGPSINLFGLLRFLIGLIEGK